MLFIASEKCLESSYWLWKSQRITGPAWASKKREKESSKNEKKREEGKAGWGFRFKFPALECAIWRYLLALPNIVWPRRSLSKHRKDNRCHIVFLFSRVGPTTTDHHRVFQLTKPSLRRFSNFLIIWRMQSFPYVIPFIGFLWQLCRISGMWNTCAWLYNCKIFYYGTVFAFMLSGCDQNQSNTITVELLCFDQWGSRSTRCSLSVGLWALEMFAVSCMENCRRNIHACCWILRNGRWCVHGFTQRRWAVGFSTSRWKRFRQSACHFQGKDIDIACTLCGFRQVASWVSLFCS